MNNKKIVFICGGGDSLIRFRLEFIKRFLEQSYEVYAYAPEISDGCLEELLKLNVKFEKISFERKNLDPINTIKSIIDVTQKLKLHKPDIVFSYTHKSVVVGSICAYLAKIKSSYSLITGTGHIFDQDTVKQRIQRFIGLLGFKIALRLNQTVFFQNPDDLKLFTRLKIISSQRSVLVNGSGVDLKLFSVKPLPEEPIFLCLSRLIKSKGLVEYAKAAKITRKQFPNARFLLHGFPDDHYDSINEQEIIDNWNSNFGIEYLGFSSNPIDAISKCSVYVLLSYNEGTPRSVLEAMAMGRPIITTNVSGCRETVKDEYNGFLVPQKDFDYAASCMMKLMDPELRSEMGKASRIYCEQKYNVHEVNSILLQEMEVI